MIRPPKIIQMTLCLFALWTFSVANAEGAATAGRITNVRAFLYYHGKGKFSNRDLLSGQILLWNVFSAKGDIGDEFEPEGSSSSMLVLVSVRVRSPSAVDRTHAIVKLLGRSGTKVLSTQDVSLRPYFIKQSTIEVPFMIYDIGCEPLELTANLEIKGKKLNSVSKTANFKCGE